MASTVSSKGACKRAAALGLAALIAAAAAAPVAGGGDGARAGRGPLVYQVVGRDADYLGSQLVVLGDADGDGVRDFAASRWIAKGDADGDRPGQVDLFSGKDGRVIRTWKGTGLDSLGHAGLGAVPDADGDGVLELAMYAVRKGYRVVSPVTGQVLYEIPPQPAAFEDDSHFLILSDLDGDGVAEYVTSNGDATLLPSLYHAGRIWCRSGRTGAVLWQRYGTLAVGHLGRSLALVGDYDRDGAPDFLAFEWVQDYWSRNGTERRSAVRLLSGRTGATLGTLEAPSDLHFGFGYSMASLGDRDGDGLQEVAIAAPFYRRDDAPDLGPYSLRLPDRGWVGVYRLPGFDLLFSQEGRQPTLFGEDGDRLGIQLSSAGDLDGDGVEDLLAATERSANSQNPWYGRLYLVSGRTGETLAVYEGRQFFDYEPFFGKVSPLGDLDGDGRPEFLATSQYYEEKLHEQGTIVALRYEPGSPRFIRGDANGDGRVNIADALLIAQATEPGRCLPGAGLPCPAACDVFLDGCISSADVFTLLDHLFHAFRDVPPPPYPDCARYARLPLAVDFGLRHLECTGGTACGTE